MARLVKVWHVGKISYPLGLQLQKHLANLHNKNIHINNTLLCLEHTPVYTTGIRTKQYTEEEASKLKSKGKYFKILKYIFCLLMLVCSLKVLIFSEQTGEG